MTIKSAILLITSALQCFFPLLTQAEEITTAHISETAFHGTKVKMYKSPNCDCCAAWAKHLQKFGYQVTTHKRDDMDVVKTTYGVSSKNSSCHTALIEGYVIEGHVPAEDVNRLLRERPNIVGLTAPGMPMHSPGMQAANKKPHGYDVLAWMQDGQVTIFHHYP